MDVTYISKEQEHEYFEHAWNAQDANMVKFCINSKADIDYVNQLVENVKIQDFEYVAPNAEGMVII